MTGVLWMPDGTSLTDVSVAGQPELYREIAQLYRCGCREIHVLLPDGEATTPHFPCMDRRKNRSGQTCPGDEPALQDPLLSIHALQHKSWTGKIADLLERKPAESLLLMEGGTVVQEEELLLFGQYTSELMPGNYIGTVAPEAVLGNLFPECPVFVSDKRMSVERIGRDKVATVPQERERSAAAFAGMCCLSPEIVPALRGKSPDTFSTQASPRIGIIPLLQGLATREAVQFSAYPFSQILRLCQKRQVPEAERLLTAPFPLLLIETETPGKGEGYPSPTEKHAAEPGLFRRIARELRLRNRPCICYNEPQFADLPFFFPFVFYAGDNTEVRELLDILAGEGCRVISPADLNLGEYLPISKNMEEAIAKSLIDTCLPDP